MLPRSCVQCAVLLILIHWSSWHGSTQGLAQEPAATLNETRVIFCAMGDVPYALAEDALLPKQIADLPKDAQFHVHVGDIKNGKSPCHEAVYIKVSGMLSKAMRPVFIVPGDNEWNDCVDPDPLQAWAFWERHFMRLDQRWQHNLPVFRQINREENFSFVINGVLFVGINMVGGRIHDAAEWKQRHDDCLEWLRSNLHQFAAGVSSLVIFGHAGPGAKHSHFFNSFTQDAQDFDKPILYLHGDGHRWIHDRPFQAKNILRVQVDQGGKAPPLKTTVTDHPTEPFVFERGDLTRPDKPPTPRPAQ